MKEVTEDQEQESERELENTVAQENKTELELENTVEQDKKADGGDKPARIAFPPDLVITAAIAAGPPPTKAETAAAEAKPTVSNILKESLRMDKMASTAIAVIAGAVVLGMLYLGKPVLVTLMSSVLIAFMLEPMVRVMKIIHIPRWLGSLIAVLLATALLYFACYSFYNKALEFAQEFPKNSGSFRQMFAKVNKGAQELQDTGKQLVTPTPDDKDNKKVITVKPSSASLTENFGTIGELLAILTFIPFLVYFMLTTESHMRVALVRLFRYQNRELAYETLSHIADMIRSFLLGNLIIGLFMSAAGAAVFWYLHIPYFYIVGLVSGFLSLIPYFGVLLALFPPIAAGLGHMDSKGFGLVLLTVLGLHLFSMNVLYPRILGKRLELNPLVITISMLIWGWAWGAMGLILAVPMTGALKIICDNVDVLNPVGALMGESILPEEKTG